jgi:hypothetical protein
MVNFCLECEKFCEIGKLFRLRGVARKNIGLLDFVAVLHDCAAYLA